MAQSCRNKDDGVDEVSIDVCTWTGPPEMEQEILGDK